GLYRRGPAYKGKGPFGERPEVRRAPAIPVLQGGRHAIGVRKTGAIAIADPAHLVLDRLVLGSAAEFADERGVGCSHLAIGLGEFGILADRAINGVVGLGTIEARPA